MATIAPRLGDILVAHGALSREWLETCMPYFHGRIGEALRAYGIVKSDALARAVAEQHAIPYVNLYKTSANTRLFAPRDYTHYLAYHFVPIAREQGTLTLATSEPCDALHAFAAAHYGCDIRFVTTSVRELHAYLSARAAAVDTRLARLGLRRRFANLCADRIALPHQLRGFAIILACIIGFIILSPYTAWHVLLIICNLFYAVTLLTKIVFYYEGVCAERSQHVLEQQVMKESAALNAADLPVYSILVPMYRESSAVMARLIASICALDYPKEKLDVKLIVEADDDACLEALKALQPPAFMEIIAVPPSAPRTKPKACNVALARVRGEYCVIYDAEDAPAPDQLKRALVMFQHGPETLACVQARLNYYNRDENILTQMFSLEYSSLFRLLLPALERMGLPIPLGGTSNHLKTAALRAVGGWDAFNVTEDADLGIRLAYMGYSTHTLPSITLEESPITLKAWMMQRTRWIKGYLQTWLVYTRDTKLLKERLGSAGYYGFQFFIGAPALTFLLAPCFWAIFILSLTGALGDALPVWLQMLCAFSFVGGVLSHWLFARKAMHVEGWQCMQRAFMLYPFYWLLHSFAAARALWQLFTAPHYWEKTLHGVSNSFTHEAIDPSAIFSQDTLFAALVGALPKRS